MTMKRFFVDFVTVFAVTLIVSVAVSLLWNIVVHGAIGIDLEASTRLAIVFGIIVAWMGTRRSKAP